MRGETSFLHEHIVIETRKNHRRCFYYTHTSRQQMAKEIKPNLWQHHHAHHANQFNTYSKCSAMKAFFFLERSNKCKTVSMVIRDEGRFPMCCTMEIIHYYFDGISHTDNASYQLQFWMLYGIEQRDERKNKHFPITLLAYTCVCVRAKWAVPLVSFKIRYGSCVSIFNWSEFEWDSPVETE